MLRVLCLVTYALCFTSSVIGADNPANLAEIRDIHMALPGQGFPPFIFSTIIILLGISFAASRAVRKKPALALPEHRLPASSDALHKLRNSFEKGEISVFILCERLAQLIRTELMTDDNPALTNFEIIETASESLPVEMLNRIAGLLDFCDAVRFGAKKPEVLSVLLTLDEARLVFNRSTDISS